MISVEVLQKFLQISVQFKLKTEFQCPISSLSLTFSRGFSVKTSAQWMKRAHVFFVQLDAGSFGECKQMRLKLCYFFRLASSGITCHSKKFQAKWSEELGCVENIVTC